MNSPQTNNQKKMKFKETKIRLNMRQPYAQHVEETLILFEVQLNIKKNSNQKQTVIILQFMI